jgi:hypothetical protein
LKDKYLKRIDAMEMPSLIEKPISDELESLEQFETFEEYFQFLPAGSAGRKLLALFPELEFPKSEGSNRKTESKVAPIQKRAMARWFFRQKLVLKLNSRAHDLIGNCRHQLELTEVISLAENLLAASNPTFQWRTASDIGKFAQILIRKRGCIVSNLRELRSLQLTWERISEKYGKGSKLLLKPLLVEFDEIYRKTQQCADEYSRALNELRSRPLPFDIEWPPDLCEIDFGDIEKLATGETDAIVGELVNCAKGETLIGFDRLEEAYEILKPHLEAEAADPE